jgi:hypothetical protein
MAEADFERQLVGLFADAPALPDADLFARQVERRLEAGWGMRRFLIGGLGAVGGLIAAVQMASASLQLRAENVALPSLRDMGHQVDTALAGPASVAGLSADTLIMSVGLAVVALALGLTRLVRAI